MKRARQLGLVTKDQDSDGRVHYRSKEDILQEAKQSLMSAEELNAITDPDVFRKTAFKLGLTVRCKAAGS